MNYLRRMLDASALAKVVTSFITPVIPYLLKGKEQAWEEASKKVGADAWELIKSVWIKLTSYSKSAPGDQDRATKIVYAATEVASNPSDEDAIVALRFQIKKLLTDNPDRALEIERSIHEFRRKSPGQTNIRIGGVDIENSTNITNSGNIVGGNQIVSD